MESLGSILAKQAPDLLERTKLPRNDCNYLTQKQAFDLHRKRRLEELAKDAPDLFERLSLPDKDPERLDTSRALAIWHGRKLRLSRISASMNSETEPQFDVTSYIGSDIAQMRPDGEKPPKSAKLVASVDMGSGPGGGDYRTYVLSTNRRRSGWCLWMLGSDYDTGKRLFCRIAWGEPYSGVPPKAAAQMLLTKSWEDERDQGALGGTIIVERAGLLDDEDIQEIERSVFHTD